MTSTATSDRPVPAHLRTALERMVTSGVLDADLLEAAREHPSIGVAVLRYDAEGLATWDASSETAFTACEAELIAGSGPALRSLEQGSVVLVADLAACEEAAWLVWRKVAVQLGWRSVVAAPVRWDGGSGAVAVYQRQVGELSVPGVAGDAGEGR